MSWDGWMGVTSDGWAACQPPDPDTAQSAILLKVPLSQTGLYGCHAPVVKASSSLGSDPQRAFSLSGAECRSKTSNSTLFKFRLYPHPHPLRFRDRTMSDKTEGVKLSLKENKKVNHFYSIYSENFYLFSGFRDTTVHFFLSLILFSHMHYTHIIEEHSINVTVRWNSDYFSPLFK